MCSSHALTPCRQCSRCLLAWSHGTTRGQAAAMVWEAAALHGLQACPWPAPGRKAESGAWVSAARCMAPQTRSRWGTLT